MSQIKEQLEKNQQAKNEELDANYKVSLYNILDAKEFVSRIDMEENLEEYSKSLAIQEKNKVNAIVGFLQETELTVENAEKESKRLADIATFYKNRAKRIKQSVSYAMQAHGVEKIETDYFRLSFRKSESVLVDDVESLSEEYIVTKKSPNKVAIKKALKNGQTIEGARIIETNNLQVK